MATTNTRPAECCEASVVGRQQNYASAMGEPKGPHACWAERSPEGGFGILHGVATGTASRAIRGAAPSSAFGWRVVHGVPRDAATGLHRPLETRGALTIHSSGDAGNLPILAVALAVDVAALTRGCRRAVPPCRRCGGLAVLRTHGEAHSYTRGATVELTPQRGRESGQRTDRGAATLIRGACARCMAREMGPPRRGEDCAGAFTRGVQQSAGWCRHVARRHSGFASEGGPLPAGRLVSIVSHAPVAQLAEPVHVPLWVTTGGCGWVAGSSPAGRNFPFREVTK